MKFMRRIVVVFAAMALASCDCEVPTAPGGPNEPNPVGNLSLVSLVVTGQNQLKVGDTAPLTATATYSDGTSANVTAQSAWASSAAAICTVSEGGVATGKGAGTCEVSATFTAVSGRTNLEVTVDPAKPTPTPIPPGAVTVSHLLVSGPGSINVGQTVGWQATAVYSNDTQANVTAQASWSSASPGIASAGANGQVTGLTAGNTTIQATYEGASGNGALVVSVDGGGATVLSLAVNGNTSIQAGQTSQLQAVATMSNGTTQTVTNTATWASNAASVATVSATGLVTGITQGSAPVRATFQGKSASVTMQVSAPPQGGPTVLNLIIQGTTCNAVGASSQLQAIAQMSDGTTQNRTATATWTTGNAGVATVSAGLVQCVDVGSTTITATIPGPFSAGVGVTVVATPPTVLSLAVSGNTSIQVGQTSQLQAVATMSNGTTQTVTNSATWSSAATGVATVSSTGLVTGASQGQSQVSATYQGKSGSVTMQVSSAPVTVTGVSIQGPPCTVVGGANQLQAIAQMSDGSTQNRTATATWASSSPAVATVPGGLMQCQSPGTTTISATVPGPVSGSIIVTVSAAPKQLIGIRVDVEGNILTGNGPVGLGLLSLLQDPLLSVNVFALFNDGSEQNVTSLAAVTTSSPLLVVNGPGVVNAAGVLTQALINPSHYINVSYQGFTVIANVVINVPVLGQLPITGLLVNGPLASLGVGTKLPDLTAILSGPGVQGTVNLLVPSATAGILWDIRPKALTNCGLLAVACGLANTALQGLGNLANGVVHIANGNVQSLTLGPLNTILAPVVSLLGGVLEVNVTPIINGVVGPVISSRIPL